MSQKTKLTIEDVKTFISSKGCELLTDEYNNMKQILEIKCSCGEKYSTTLDSFKFKNKSQCNECGKKLLSKSKTSKFEEVKYFIENKGCRLLSKYKNAKEKIKIQCACGMSFERSFNKFKSGQTKCRKCIGRNDWNFETVKKFIEEESKSDNKLITKSYKNRRQALTIQCNCGEEYSTDFHTFLYGNKRKCDECVKEIVREKTRKGIDYLKNYVIDNSDAILLSENYEDYHQRLLFQCKCSNTFKTSFVCFTNGKRSCDICSPTSKLEFISEKFFIENNINYLPQYTFKDLVSPKGRNLKFDFAILNSDNTLNFLLELDGEQHFKPSNGFGGQEKFEQTKLYDEIKNTYCLDNSITLHRISYKEIHNLENVLLEIISKHDNPVPSLEGNLFEGATTRVYGLSHI